MVGVSFWTTADADTAAGGGGSAAAVAAIVVVVIVVVGFVVEFKNVL